MKVKQELKLDRYEMSMLRWMCGINMKVGKENMEIRKLLGAASVC